MTGQITHPASSGPQVEMMSSDEVWEKGRRCTISVEARTPMIEFSDGTKQGYMMFKVFCTDVSDDDDEKIGSIYGGTGAVVVTIGNETWHIRHSDLWYAFQEALKTATPKIIYDKETGEPT